MAKKPYTFYFVAAAFSITAIAFLLIWIAQRQALLKQLPVLPETGSLTTPVREQLQEASRTVRRHPSGDNIGKLGMAYNANVFYEEAEACYRIAAKEDRKTWIWDYYLGYLHLEMSDAKAAIADFNSVLEKEPGVHLARYYSGDAFQKIGDLRQAEIRFGEVTGANKINHVSKTASRNDYFPLDVYAKYQLARICLETEQTERAEALLNEIITGHKSFGPAYRLMGIAVSAGNDQSRGHPFTVRANDLAMYSPPVDTLVDQLSLMSRSQQYLLKKIDEAENGVYPLWAMQLIDKALLFMPENSYLVSKAVKLRLITGNEMKAMPLLDKHMEYFRLDYDELRSTAELLLSVGLYPQARNYFSLAFEQKPGIAANRLNMALCLYHEGLLQQATDLIRELTEAHSNDGAVLADCAVLLMTLGNKDDAKSLRVKMKKIAPGDPAVLKVSGIIAQESGKWNEAIELFKLSFAGDPGDLVTTRYLVNSLMRQRNWQASISYLRKALEHHPNEPFLLERLGTLLVSCPDRKFRDVNEGRYLSERAFIHIASHSSTLISAGRSLAVAYATLGDGETAATVMGKTIQAAKQEKVPGETIAELEKLLQQFSTKSKP